MKYIVMILMCVLSMTANAQYTGAVGYVANGEWKSLTLPYYTTGDDTATDADVIRMGTKMNGKYDVVVKVVSTKVSGTVGGSLFVRVSPDGTNWFTLNEGKTLSYEDTATLANATTTYLFSYSAVPAMYIEAYYSQTGTCVSAPVTTLYYRKHDD